MISTIQGLDVHLALADYTYPIIDKKKGSQIPPAVEKIQAIINIKLEKYNVHFKCAVSSVRHKLLKDNASNKQTLASIMTI